MAMKRNFTSVVLTRATADDTSFDRSRDVSPDVTDYETIASRAGARDQLRLRRTLPSNTSSVTASKKGEAKFTRDISYVGADGRTTILPLIIGITYSLPVVATDTQVNLSISDIRSLVIEADFLESLIKLQAV